MARPVLSTDDIKSDKHKMERFLHAGRPSVATVFAPICFPPMPLLAFKCAPGEKPVLAMNGALWDGCYLPYLLFLTMVDRCRLLLTMLSA